MFSWYYMLIVHQSDLYFILKKRNKFSDFLLCSGTKQLYQAMCLCVYKTKWGNMCCHHTVKPETMCTASARPEDKNILTGKLESKWYIMDAAGTKRYYTEKRKLAHAARSRTQVTLHLEYDRWKTLKSSLNLKFHHQLAKVLLDW